MKFYLTFLALCLCTTLLAQPCQQVNVAATPQQNSLLREYIKISRQKHFFFEDKGVVKLVIYQDADGTTCWHLSTLVDDRYRSLPPAQYAYVNNDVVLIYKGDSTGTALSAGSDANKLNLCVQEIVGSRVYECSAKGQFVYVQDANGKSKKVPVTRISGGNIANDIIVKFNRDGSITKVTPV